MSACDRCQPIGSYRRRNTTSRRGRNGITISCCGDKGLILPWHSFRKGNHVLTYRIRDTGSRPDNLNGKFVWIVGAVESYLGGSRLESEPCYRLFRSNFCYFLHFHKQMAGQYPRYATTSPPHRHLGATHNHVSAPHLTVCKNVWLVERC